MPHFYSHLHMDSNHNGLCSMSDHCDSKYCHTTPHTHLRECPECHYCQTWEQSSGEQFEVPKLLEGGFIRNMEMKPIDKLMCKTFVWRHQTAISATQNTVTQMICGINTTLTESLKSLTERVVHTSYMDILWTSFGGYWCLWLWKVYSNTASWT